MQRKGRTGKEPEPTQPSVVTDRQTDLEGMRALLLAAIQNTGARDLPALCRELRAVDAELETLSSATTVEQAYVDDLKERRRARRTAS